VIGALLLCLSGAWQQDPASLALAEGRYGDAWELALAAEDATERARGRAAVLVAAGDLGGTLSAVEEGLARSPEHLELLWRGASTALSLREAQRAADYTGRLARALAVAELADEHRAGWQAAVDDFEARGAELQALGAARADALRRARRWSAILVAGGLGVLVLGGRTRSAASPG
jgi:hypothetical protein